MNAHCRRCGGRFFRDEAAELACLQCGARRYDQEPDRRPRIGGVSMRQRIAAAALARAVATGEQRLHRRHVRRLALKYFRLQLLMSWALAFVAGVAVGLAL